MLGPQLHYDPRHAGASKIVLTKARPLKQDKCPFTGCGPACKSGPEKGVITKGVFSLEESLESLNSLESLENGRILLYFQESGDSLKSLESLNSLESLENGLF